MTLHESIPGLEDIVWTGDQMAVRDQLFRDVAYIGARQIGKTITGVVKATEAARSGLEVGYITPTHRMASSASDLADDLAFDVGDSTRLGVEYDRGSIDFVPENSLDPEHITPSRFDYDHVVIDNVSVTDHPESIYNASSTKSCSVTVLGTPSPESSRLSDLIEQHSIETFTASMYDCHWIDDDRIREFENSIGDPRQVVCEVYGDFVTKPGE